MSDRKPLILITNDDGYQAKGIAELINVMKGLGELVVFAPDSHRSGMSSAITTAHPLRARIYHKEENLQHICATEHRLIVLSWH